MIKVKLLLLKRTPVWFQAPTWKLKTMWSFSSKGSHAFSTGTRHEYAAIHTHIFLKMRILTAHIIHFLNIITSVSIILTSICPSLNFSFLLNHFLLFSALIVRLPYYPMTEYYCTQSGLPRICGPSALASQILGL